MKPRRALPPLLLLFSVLTLPTVAREKALDTERLHAGSPEAKNRPPIDTGKESSVSGSKSKTGTKGAPVDGLDGKPHNGPYVEVEESPEQKRKKAASESLQSTHDGLDASASHASSDKSSDSSLDEDDDETTRDRSTSSGATGHIGTEGGVSQKDKDRKTQERLGTSKGKTPDSPKEPIELPDTIEDRIDLKEKTEKGGNSQKSDLDEDKSWIAAGMEASFTGCDDIDLHSNVFVLETA